jgi:hypothetical protein
LPICVAFFLPIQSLVNFALTLKKIKRKRLAGGDYVIGEANSSTR